MHACMHAWMDGWMDGCVCIYIYIYMHVHMHVYVSAMCVIYTMYLYAHFRLHLNLEAHRGARARVRLRTHMPSVHIEIPETLNRSWPRSEEDSRSDEAEEEVIRNLLSISSFWVVMEDCHMPTSLLRA